MEHKLDAFFLKKTTLEEEEKILNWLDASEANCKLFIRERELYNMVLLHTEKKRASATAKKIAPGWVKEVIRMTAMIALVFGLYWNYNNKNEAVLSAVNTITVPLGQRVDLELPDGTKVTLNSGSELKYPAVFSKGSRKVALRGNAFFNVSHDPNRPFIVETTLCDIEVLGTTFDVETYPNSGSILTTLITGKVMLTDNNDIHNQIVLYPGQEAYYANGQFTVNPLKYPDRLRWKEGLLCFHDMTLGSLLKDFERYYDVQIEVRNPEIVRHELSGKLKIGDGVDHALRVLQKSIAFEYSKNNNNDNVIIIY